MPRGQPGKPTELRWLDPLSAWSMLAFVVLVVLWLAFQSWPEPDPRWFRAISRPCAYAAAVALLVPYLHIGRRSLRHRYLGIIGIWINRHPPTNPRWYWHWLIPTWGRLATWLRWHVVAAYAGFGFAIVHSRARSNNELTFMIQLVLWAVMISGVVGLYGQKLIYRLMALMVKEELGLDRLELERRELVKRAEELIKSMPTLIREDVVQRNDVAQDNWSRLCERLEELGRQWKKQPASPQTTEMPRTEPKVTSMKSVRNRLRNFGQRWKKARVDTHISQGAEGGPELTPCQKEWQQLQDAVDRLRNSLIPPKNPDPDKEIADILVALNNLVQQKGFFDLAGSSTLTPPVRLTLIAGNAPAARTGSEARTLNHWLLGELLTKEVLVPASTRTEAINGFLSPVFTTVLNSPLASWSWLFSAKALSTFPKNHYLQIHGLSGHAQRQVLEKVWELVETRRQLDLESALHQLGRIWLLVHGPASWALLVLVLVHITLSVQYGGY